MGLLLTPTVGMTSATTSVSLYRYGALSYFGAVVAYKAQGIALGSGNK